MNGDYQCSISYEISSGTPQGSVLSDFISVTLLLMSSGTPQGSVLSRPYFYDITSNVFNNLQIFIDNIVIYLIVRKFGERKVWQITHDSPTLKTIQISTYNY